MRVLFDTHVLVWALIQPDKMPAACERVLNDSSNEFLFSSVNVWEIAIKSALGRPDFDLNPMDVLRAARATPLVEIPVKSSAAVRVAALPHHHRDPFDRILIAQAIDEAATLLTIDEVLAAYGSHVLVLN